VTCRRHAHDRSSQSIFGPGHRTAARVHPPATQWTNDHARVPAGNVGDRRTPRWKSEKIKKRAW
jgi:hypothetical protein